MEPEAQIQYLKNEKIIMTKCAQAINSSLRDAESLISTEK